MNANFNIFWKAHGDDLIAMLQPTCLTGMSAKEYQKSQSKAVAELIYMAGMQDGATETLRESTGLLKILNKELNDEVLSTDEQEFKQHMSVDTPNFLKRQAQ